MMIIDSHVHLWKKQNGINNGRPVVSLKNGRSDFGGEIRQMMPPYMLNGENNAEMLLSNMDYAGVSAAVVTQEFLDGNQDGYLLEVKRNTPDRFKICAYYDGENKPAVSGFDGIKFCACKMKDPDVTAYADVFETARKNGMFLAVELADGDTQTGSMLEMIRQYPDLRIVIGHFGMVNREGWQAQIRLAREKNVYIESGGITWLFHKEFYPYPSAVKAIGKAAEICGMQKLMWGSDYPRTMTDITYKMSYDFIMKSMDFTEEEKELFFYKNAEHFYRFDSLRPVVPVRNMLED